jgi:NAD(P)-dependent dehydrogenase (short-subunit alcohol dehydrogenase family)
MSTTVLDQFSLSGTTAVVTGAGGALCGAMARALGAIGVHVAVLDLDPASAEKTAAEIRAAGGDAASFACDVLNESSLESARAAVEDRWGAAHLLINGAGGNNPKGSTTAEFVEPGAITGSGGFFDLDRQGFEQTFDLNFIGTFLPTKVFARGMAARGSGAILNMASMSSLTPLTKVGAYSAAKAAVANFTSWLAVHLAHVGIRVNALAPGFFMTEQLRFLHIDRATGDYTPRARKAVAHTPMGRYGEPDDLLGAMVWLLSDASRFVTGIVVPIDGGFSSYSV